MKKILITVLVFALISALIPVSAATVPAATVWEFDDLGFSFEMRNYIGLVSGAGFPGVPDDWKLSVILLENDDDLPVLTIYFAGESPIVYEKYNESNEYLESDEAVINYVAGSIIERNHWYAGSFDAVPDEPLVLTFDKGIQVYYFIFAYFAERYDFAGSVCDFDDFDDYWAARELLWSGSFAGVWDFTWSYLALTPSMADEYLAAGKFKDIFYQSDSGEEIITEIEIPGLRELILAARTPAAPALTATPSDQRVTVDGEEAPLNAYLINNRNYFKLRDLAYMLNGTEKQFNVDWDEASGTISLISGEAYDIAGGEMESKDGAVRTPVSTLSVILLDSEEVSLDAYLIDGNNYFQLRQLGELFDFFIDWDNETGTIIIDTSKGNAILD